MLAWPSSEDHDTGHAAGDTDDRFGAHTLLEDPSAKTGADRHLNLDQDRRETRVDPGDTGKQQTEVQGAECHRKEQKRTKPLSRPLRQQQEWKSDDKEPKTGQQEGRKMLQRDLADRHIGTPARHDRRGQDDVEPTHGLGCSGAPNLTRYGRHNFRLGRTNLDGDAQL